MCFLNQTHKQSNRSTLGCLLLDLALAAMSEETISLSQFSAPALCTSYESNTQHLALNNLIGWNSFLEIRRIVDVNLKKKIIVYIEIRT